MRVDFHFPVQNTDRMAMDLRSWGAAPGYQGVFLDRWCTHMGVPIEDAKKITQAPVDEVMDLAKEVLAPYAHSSAQTRQLIDDADLDAVVVHDSLPSDLPRTADEFLASLHGIDERIIPFPRLRLESPAADAEQLRRLVTEKGCRGATMTPFWSHRSTDSEELLPIFEEADSLGCVLWIHTSSHWRLDIPLTLEHPLMIDRLATRFPNVRLVMGHGGYPWMTDAVAVAARHPNVYIDISAFRPRNIFRAGSGWEQFVYYAAHGLGSKIVLGTTWSMLGMTPQAVLDEAAQAPLPTKVIDGWLGNNAALLLKLEPAR